MWRGRRGEWEHTFVIGYTAVVILISRFGLCLFGSLDRLLVLDVLLFEKPHQGRRIGIAFAIKDDENKRFFSFSFLLFLFFFFLNKIKKN
jgi:hypothetical protein